MRFQPQATPRGARVDALRGLGLAGLLAIAAPVSSHSAEAFNLDALIAAAQKEGPITVYDSTGKIVEMGDAFTKKYGIKATGVKVKATTSLEMMIREAQAKNVKGDVLLLSDAPAGVAQILPQKFAMSWLPPDLADKIPAMYQDPLAVGKEANIWAYNTEVNKTCPVKNIWELTDSKWKGKLAMQDPLKKETYADWFNQTAMHADDKVSAAYKEHFGTDLKLGKETATAAWVKALGANAPLLTDADEKISEAVGAPGQKEPFVGLMSSAKFRDNEALGYKLGLCADLKPWPGYVYLKLGVIASGTNSPNAAKLFMHYVMTAEGIAPQAADGKISTNVDVGLPADEPSGLGKVLDKLLPYNTATALKDWDARQDWQDFWRINYKK
jgi:iron(III) transport system substrate-binding protein